MSKEKLYTLQNMVAWLLLCLGMVALLCVGAVSCQKQSCTEAQEEALPAGKYPVVLTAGELHELFATPSGTRGTVDNDWNGVETIAVRMYEETKPYKVTSTDGGATVTLSSDDPHYWKYTGETTIYAWSPYSEQPDLYQFVVKADQSTAAGYQASDRIYSETLLDFADRNDPTKNRLSFSHATAKITVNLIAGDGIDLSEGAAVQLLNIPSHCLDTGTTITPYQPDSSRHTYVALLPGGSNIWANTQFIKVTVGGNTFVYTTPNDNTVFKSSRSYTYDITVNTQGIDVNVASENMEWADGGSEDVACRTLIAEYTAADVKKGDYIYKDGTTSDGGLRKLYDNGDAVCEATKPQPRATADNPVVGIVFWTPSETLTEGRRTPARLTDDKIMAADYPACTHGLAVAMNRCYYNSLPYMAWQTNCKSLQNFQNSANFTHSRKADFAPIASAVGSGSSINYILGYQNTVILRAFNDYCRANGETGNLVIPVTTSPSDVAPSGSTGWFFPSEKELYILCYYDVDDIHNQMGTRVPATRDIVDASLSAAGGQTLESDMILWSSTEYDQGVPTYDNDNAYKIDFRVSILSVSRKEGGNRVRMVCAF